MLARRFGLVCTFAFLALVAQAGAAGAHPSGKIVPATATGVQVFEISVPPYFPYTITTSNLQPNVPGATADTVVHVQALDAQGSFAFGDDDGGVEPWSSQVVIPSSASWRKYMVIVRAFNDLSAGTCHLTFSGSSTTTYLIGFAGSLHNVPPFDANTDFWTSEAPLGISNSVILVLSGQSDHAIAFDDDDGVGGMSYVRVAQACTDSCRVVVARKGGEPGVFATRLYWDGDVQFADCDGDGLGDSLEGAISTAPCSADSDGDGLKDAEEVRGILETATTYPVIFSRWGANPLVKDVFIEADYDECLGCPNPHQYQFTAAAALQAASLYPPDIRLHIDNGVFNEDPATSTIYGQFGGGTLVNLGTGYDCGTLSPERQGLFHHYFSIGGGGGQGYWPGSCAFGAVSGAVMAHELGHNLGLNHGGNTPSVNVNCKPHYRSQMNYAYSYRADIGFSSNAFASVVLNPTNLDEGFGLGTTNAAVMADLQGPIFKYKVNTSTGAVDWNRDGTYGAGVRGAPTANFAGGGCEQSWYHLSSALQPAKGAALAWLPPSFSSPFLYLFTRRPSDNKIEYRTASIFDCAGKPWNQGCGDWSPAAGSPANLVADVLAAGSAPAVAAFSSNGTPKMMLVYAGTNQALRFQIGTIVNATTGAMSFSAPAILNSLVTASDPEIRDAGPGGALRVYAREFATQRLRSWDYNPATGTWSAGKVELWSDGTDVLVQHGIGITRGFFKNLAGLQTVGAFPSVFGGGNQVDTARLDPTTDRWIKLAGWTGRVSSATKVSLAYVPYNASVSSSLGRYLMTFTLTAGGSAKVILTEGNDLSGSAQDQRYLWGPTNFLVNTWANTATAVPLLYDLLYDNALRAVWVQGDNQATFLPFADGIDNLQLKDNDDLAYIRSSVACSIGKGACPPL